jgi:hypothetical protein
MSCLPNALRFSGGPNSPTKAKQDATTGASRTMEAKPRLAPSKIHQPTKAGRCKRELYPAATSSTAGSGGHDVNESRQQGAMTHWRRAAPSHQNGRKRDASECQA